MVAMAICYGSMSRELWGQRQIGESIQRQGESIASKRKVSIIKNYSARLSFAFPHHALL